jgi:hypothetical protein
MAKNLGREFATMSEDERRRFAREQAAADDVAEQLEFGDPRNDDAMGKGYATPSDEVADPEERDGMGALLDDKEHKRRVAQQGRTKSDDSDDPGPEAA